MNKNFSKAFAGGITFGVAWTLCQYFLNDKLDFGGLIAGIGYLLTNLLFNIGKAQKK
ncbi:hypothetical protein [Cohnella lupini]|uniref:hypothetical protein n=1 Tax=Cohnella lupini TaxID=1294267 RepID=UPI0015F27774|nr:hypothetical protein [Cohnella lupini]